MILDHNEVEGNLILKKNKCFNFSYSGDFSPTIFLNLLKKIISESFTGVLTLSDMETKLDIYFENGVLVKVMSHYIPGYTLGAVLIENKIINESDYKIAKRYYEECKALGQNLRYGEILYDLGKINSKTLLWALKFQEEKKILRAFQIEEGKFIFKEGKKVIDDIKLPNLDMYNPILKGIENNISQGFLRKKFKEIEEKSILKFTEPNFLKGFNFNFEENERKFIEGLSSNKKLVEIIEKSSLKKVRTYQLLTFLETINKIEFLVIETKIKNRILREREENNESITNPNLLNKIPKIEEKKIIDNLNIEGEELFSILRGKKEKKVYTREEIIRLAKGGESLKNANLQKLDLSNINLESACLVGANFRFSNLRNANFMYADLTGADLSHVNLYNADLRYAILNHTNFEGANLFNAKIYGAIIENTIFSPEQKKVINFKKSNSLFSNLFKKIILSLF